MVATGRTTQTDESGGGLWGSIGSFFGGSGDGAESGAFSRRPADPGPDHWRRLVARDAEQWTPALTILGGMLRSVDEIVAARMRAQTTV
ncbi:MAG: hypothetical protein ACRDD1_11095, partial [Planctomycetia bacterium]